MWRSKPGMCLDVNDGNGDDDDDDDNTDEQDNHNNRGLCTLHHSIRTLQGT